MASLIHPSSWSDIWTNRGRRRPTAARRPEATQGRGQAGWPARVGTLPAPRVGRQDAPLTTSSLQNGVFRAVSVRPGAQGLTGPATTALGTIGPATVTCDAKEIALSAPDPNYDPATDTYRQIYQGHDNASAVTNSEGLTVYFDPDTNDVLGFAIAAFSAYYKKHSTPEGEFEVSLPAKVPPGIEEEMDFDAETMRSGVRIAEFY